MFAFWVHDLSPFLIRFGPNWGIRYYGLAYALGFVILYLGLHYQARRGWSRLRGPAIDNFVTWMALAGVIAGGRLGYCLLYDWKHTAANPLSIFEVWNGGMASHGGIIGAITVLYFYSRAHRIPFYNLADATALCTPVALGLGRIANFINGELWGRPSTVPWAVIFPEAPRIDGINVPRHPSQIYEAFLEGVVLFSILWVLRHRTKRDGVVALSFMGGYAILRIIGEQFREPDENIGFLWFGITQGQALSFGMLILTIILAAIQFRPKNNSAI